ncbi:hypothetical protein [Pseudonocardia sp. KRD291]|uniref:hypothetical protein n=1 Tax=Pseudonocardia sp. KRD291 TaxID=2792007 RepID=UPI001C4A06E5|nr:hypothetical protein [Pseudonocardia sp. KRD291]MBW0103743.1 hypothetical protein [Pseudonocardia sp. KRD291]
MNGGDRPGLAARQAALIEALVAGGPYPDGLDTARLDATRRALLRKRAGRVARAWPLLAAAHGTDWTRVFHARFDGVAPTDPVREGWDLARELRAAGTLPAAAASELAGREAAMRYDGRSAPRRRSRPAAALRRLLERSRG